MEGENVPLGKRKRNPVANSDSTFTSSRPKRFFTDAQIDHVNVHSSLSLSLSLSLCILRYLKCANFVKWLSARNCDRILIAIGYE